MRPAVPLLIATLPARSVPEARRQADAARAAGADFAEVRFDRWTAADLAHASDLFPSPLPLVATFRSRAEGGEGPDEPSARAPVLESLARLPFASVDVERGRDSLPVRPSEPGGLAGVIRSVHLEAGIPAADALARARSPTQSGVAEKVVVPLGVGVALTDLLPDWQHQPLDPSVTLLTTGASGGLVRALGRSLGLPFVFGSLPATTDSDGPVEASQLPVDQLRRYFEAAPDAPLFGVVGHPVAHSLSPRIHTRWLRESGRAGLYLPLDLLTPEEFQIVLERLPPLGFRGVNVTHPWKAEARARAHRSTARAEACGAANCLTFAAGSIVADNTDVLAATRRLEELRTQGRWDGGRVAVLGAGGAARATVVAAQSLGGHPSVYARRRRASEEFGRVFGVEVGDPHQPVPAGLVVHATTTGHTTTPLEVPLGKVTAPGAYVLDWVYGGAGADPAVARESRRAGATYEGGERLLVYQAAASFAAWWGAPPAPPSVDGALTEVGCTA